MKTTKLLLTAACAFCLSTVAFAQTTPGSTTGSGTMQSGSMQNGTMNTPSSTSGTMQNGSMQNGSMNGRMDGKTKMNGRKGTKKSKTSTATPSTM